MASASAVGSGRRCSRRSSGGVPRRANARSWVTTRRASPAAWPRAASWSARAAGEPAEDEADRLEPLGRRLQRQAEGHPLRGPSRPEPLRLLAPGPGVEPRALVPEPRDHRRARQLRHGPDRPQPEPGEPRPDVRVPREEAGRDTGARNRSSSPGGTSSGRSALRARARRRRVAAKLVPAIPARGGPGQDRARAPRRCGRRASSSIPQSRVRPSTWTAIRPNAGSVTSLVPAIPGLNDGEPLAGGLDARPGPRQARGRGRSPRARAGARSRAGSPVARRAPARADPRPPRSRPSRAVRRGRSGRVATSRRCRRSTAVSIRLRARRRGRCGQSRCSRRMGIDRWRGAFQVDG